MVWPKVDFKWYIIAALVGICLYLHSCHKCPTTGTIVKSDTIRITIPAPPPVVLKPQAIHDTIVRVDTQWREMTVAQLDTTAEQYFSVKYYKHTYEDSLISATVADTVSKNDILVQTLRYEMKKPLGERLIINNTKQEKNAFYWDIQAGAGGGFYTLAGIDWGRPRYLYHIGYGFNVKDGTRVAVVGFGWRL